MIVGQLPIRSLQDQLFGNCCFTKIAQITGIENGLLKVLLKIVGVGYITEFGAGILNDFGSNSIADKVVLGGKITIVMLSIPVMESLLSMIGGFLRLV